MKKFKKIVLMNYTGKELAEPYWDELKQLCEESVRLKADDANFSQQLKDADCLLVKLGAKVGRDYIDAAPQLKYIGMLGTGYGGIDAVYAASKNISVCNLYYATEGVAEFAFATILEYLRELERAKQQARQGDYSEATFTGTELKGKTFGIIGLGKIGARIAEIARGFGANVCYWSRKRKPDYESMSIKFLEIDEVLHNSNFVSLNLAYNPDTANFLNAKRIQTIKKGAMLINLSPMELVDLNTLVERLKKKELSFILDHSDEMTAEQLDLLKPYDNCVIYPPIAYTTTAATDLKQGIFINNLKNYLAGSPTNKVN